MLDSLLSVTPGILYIFDLVECRNVFVNAGFERILGITSLEVQALGGNLLPKLMHPEDFARYLVDIAPRYANLGSGETLTHCYRFQDRKGNWHWLESTEVAFTHDSRGQVTQIMGLALDASDRIQAEAKLRDSEYFFKESQRASRTGSYRLDVKSGVWEYSEVLGQIFGIDATFLPDIAGWLALVHPEDREMMGRHYTEDVLGKGQPFDKEYRIVRVKDGATRWVHGLGRLILGPTGEPIHMIGTIRDITEKHLADETLNLNEERLKLATSAGRIGIWDWDVRGDVLVWDESMFTIYGIDAQDFRGVAQAWAAGIHPDDRETVQSEVQAALRGDGEYSAEFRIVRPDGETRFLQAESRTFRDETGVAVRMIGVNIDITERKRAELEAMESAERLTFAMETSHIGSWELDLSTKVAQRSMEHARLFGYTDLSLPWTLDRFLGHVVEEDRSRVVATIQGAMGNAGDVSFECQMIRCDGARRWIWVAARPIAKSPGSTGKLAGIVQDITDRKSVEQELERHRSHLEELVEERTAQLEEANRELDAFCHSVSHDLRAPLRRIDGFVDLLTTNCRSDLSEDARRYSDFIASSARNMGELIDDLLHFSRTSRQEMVLGRVEMDLVLQEALSSLQESAGRVEWRIEPLAPVVGDHNLLRQVWANLLENAIKYSGGRERPIVEVSCQEADGECVFTVRDNGVGFNPRYAHKLFGVFQRLHSQNEFEGTGIGLATVHRIVGRLGGRIWAESTLDQGATFHFALPRP